MDLRSTLGSLLFFHGLCGICTGFVQENCTNYMLQFERVFSVPGDIAMLNSTLVSPEVFNFTAVPYNVTWYDSKTGREMNDQMGRILVRGETLWFLNVTMEDDGEYVTIVRTPTWCYRQSSKLVVDRPVAGECGRPKKAGQTLSMGSTDTLSCPLKGYTYKLDSYNITYSIKWYKGCDPIEDGKGKYTYRDITKLKIDGLEPQNNSAYTCTLTFTLGGIKGSVSETIDAWVKEDYCLAPEVHEPANEIIKAKMGSSFTKRCLVFVLCAGKPIVDVVWLVRGDFILDTHPSNRIYTSEQRLWRQDAPRKGVWLERLLMFSELREEDFHTNYTCRVYSDRGHPEEYFTLLPEDPNIIHPGCIFGAMMILFIISVTIYYLFKIDIVLWFRRTFPVFYTNKDMDGKLYDAYVAYPPSCAVGYSKEVETFAMQTLPQVMEKACGYKLFIAGRDCLPGQAIVNSVEENIQASRRLLLLYTASTFTGKRHTSSTSSNNNNNITKSSNLSDNTENKTRDDSNCMSFDDSEDVYLDTRQQLECVAAMHRALLEGSLKVVLVELEEITPAQLALFPESVRHLRKKQGAMCWWKNLKQRQRWKTCMRGREDEEKGGQDMHSLPSLSPSSKFWKEMRYHMPVKGKRAVHPEKTALLNL
ncbi:interleukin-1 receptor type 1 [Chaetodon auriga]|uniref:interleukin-1 receptor type 1 n=1 Tax=Chaetodon auriga TaxID=39042 RepID=UPI004032ED1A